MSELPAFTQIEEIMKSFGFTINSYDFERPWGGFLFIYESYLWVGGTVSYLSMQLAYYMGFNEVYLIGFDHSYDIPENAEVNQSEIMSNSDDPNHFDPKYIGKGYRWHDPQVDRMEKSYERAKLVFEKNNRNITNATVGGHLEVFPRVDYFTLF